VADAYGLSLEETTKILGALANFSIKGSMAGNTLKNIMLQLANSDVRAKLAQLGVATTDAAGNMLEVSEVLRNLGNSIRDMPRAQRLSIMNELFGKRAVAGGIKLTAASFDRLNEAIDQAGGTARRTAETMDSGIGGALRRLWSAVEGVAIGILSDMINGFQTHNRFEDFADRIGAIRRA
jgi:TP901 family phage tail tape measure protein